MTLSPDLSRCSIVFSPHKVERWRLCAHKILFRAEECRRFLSTLRSMSWAPDKGGAGGATCPERLGKWAGGVDFEEGRGVGVWDGGGGQLNSHLHVGPPPHHSRMGPLWWGRPLEWSELKRPRKKKEILSFLLNRQKNADMIKTLAFGTLPREVIMIKR